MMDEWTKSTLQFFKNLDRAVYSRSITLALQDCVLICGVIHTQYWLAPIAENDNAKSRI